MTMRLDIVTNDAGELVRREHARDLGASVVLALYRLARLAKMHDLGNQAFVRQLEQTHQVIGEYCQRSGAHVNILFAKKAVFVAGQLLKGARATYDSATELGELMEWCGGSDLFIARDVTQSELLGFAEAISAAMRAEKGRGFRSPTPKIRLRAVGDAARARGLDVERLPVEQRIVRNYATAVVALRRFFDDLSASRYVLPRRIKRIAQNLVDLSAGGTPAFLGVTEVRNANHDAAGRAVNTAILAVAMAREIASDRTTLAQIAMAAMMHDVGRPRAAALANPGGPRISALVARLTEDAEDRLPNGTAAVLTALGRVNEPSIVRTVIAFEALWLRRPSTLGPVYRGARLPTLHARIVAVARRYNDLLTPEPGLSPPTPDAAIALLASELGDATDRTVLRTLVAALGLLPAGTVVELSSGEVGEVVAEPSPPRGGADRGSPRLRVRVAMDAHGGVLAAPQDVDLSRPGETRRVARVVNIDGWRKANEPARAARPTEPSSPSRSAVVATDPRIPIAPLADSEPPLPPPPPPPPVIAPPPLLPRFEAERPVAVAPPPPPSSEDESFPPPDFGDEAGTSPSAVAEAMGRMIEDALRAGPPADPFATEPPAPIVAHVPVPPTPTPPPAPRQWRISDSPPKPDNASTLAEIKAASPVTLPPPEPLPHAPTARGTLGATPLAHVLVYMLDHALSGSIVFREPDDLEHVLYFQHGAVSKVQISRPSSRIGDELVASGLVSRAIITKSVEGARHLGLLLGEYLVGHDLVTREALSKALEAQIASRVASIVNLPPETTYSFYRDVDLLSALESEGVVSDPLNVILATVRAWHDRARIRATLSRIAKHPLALHPQADSTHLSFTPDERKVMDFVRESQPTTSALFQRRMADEDVVSSLVYALAVTRQFSLKGQRGAPMGGRGAALPISVAPPAAPDSMPVRFPASARAPNFSGVDLGEEAARVSALPPDPAPLNPDESRPVPAFRDRSSRLPEPTSLTERPAPLGADRTSSEVASAERALEAMGHFRLAEAAVQRSDLPEALKLAARAVSADPSQIDYVVFQTWVRAMSSGKDETALESIQSLTRLLQGEPDNERALLYRGKLLKKVGRPRDALRDFDRLVTLNPRHREAATEARLLRSKPR